MLTIKAYAKLNLSLVITGVRKDGYHELDTIMQNISLFDMITVEKASGIRVLMDAGEVDEEKNTAYLAAQAFIGLTGEPGAKIFIHKLIPCLAGLGGSSADAAAVLIALNRLYETQLNNEKLATLGKGIGADVPFSLSGGTARARGIGEKLTPLCPKKPMYYAIVKPHQGVSTAEAYSRYISSARISIDTVEYAALKGDALLFSRCAGNALGIAALGIAPEMMKAIDALKAAGASKAHMTGSGSAVFAAFDTYEEAKITASRVQGDFELCGAYYPVDTGVEIIGNDDEPV